MTHESGPLLIVAGAGTGKTTVITRRIAYLIAAKRARPEEILALTFTEKAAEEMETRVDLLVPYGYVETWIATFHAFGDRLLRESAAVLGLTPAVRVLTKAEQMVLLKEHLFDLPLRRFRPATNPTHFLQALTTLFSRAKDEDVTPEAFLAHAESLAGESSRQPADAALAETAANALELARTYHEYQRLLREHDAMDFGDQVMLALQLFREHPSILAQYRRRFRYILVDEFQDTNYAQFELIKLLAPDHANVTIVADDDQSIFKFRGAAISNILNFLQAYPQAAEVALVDNYRSPQPLLDGAYRLIQHNNPERLEVKRRINKRLMAVGRRPSDGPVYRLFDAVAGEADWVAAQIRDGVQRGRRTYRDFAILVRSNKDAEPFLRALNVTGIPWQFTGGSGLYAHEEIRVLLSWLRAVVDEQDSVSLYHAASSTILQMPMSDLLRCLKVSQRLSRPLRWAFEHVEELPELADVTSGGRAVIQECLRHLRACAEASRYRTTGQVLYHLVTETGYLKRLAGTQTLEAAEQLQTIGRFFDVVQSFERVAQLDRLPAFLQHLDALLQAGDEPETLPPAWELPVVRVLTVHKAKGLEFPVVFMVGLVQNRFPVPARRDVLDLPEPLIKDLLPAGDVHLQEERRLFYVGMTRAQEELYLTSAADYGGKSTRKVSQFVLEALNLPRQRPQPAGQGALAVLARSSVAPTPQVAASSGQAPAVLAAAGPLRLNAHRLDDYLTCPFKYRFLHVLRLPVMRHHLVMYGAAIHQAIEQFYTRRRAGGAMSLEELLEVFAQAWSSEGFLTRRHEEQRFAQGRQALTQWHARETAQPSRPALIEEPFQFVFEDVVITGRFDRVDITGDEVVIIDFKSSDISDQAKADKRASASWQMRVYAWAWRELHGRLPDRAELHFVDADLIGRAEITDAEIAETQAAVRQVAAGLRAGAFPARPDEHVCRWCAYQAICPSAAA